MSYGIDISHHQSTGALPWERIHESCSFVLCRSTYGTYRDRRVTQHFERASNEVPNVGLYHFWRAGQKDDAQWDAFCAVADAVRLDNGDIVPALDVEDDPKIAQVSPAWSAPLEAFAARMTERFGGCLIYITQRDWGRLGKPAWVTRYPLWVAHYTSKPNPAIPLGGDVRIWQHRVADFDPGGAGGFDPQARLALDQNRLLGELPLIGESVRAPDRTPTLSEADDLNNWALLRARVVDTNDRLLHDFLGEDRTPPRKG